MSRKKRAKPLKKPNAASHARRAADSFAAGEFAAAARHCRRALAADRGAADRWHLLAACLLESGDLPGALAAVGECRRLTPANPDYANTHALILSRSGADDAAAALYDDIVRAAPAHADAWYNAGKLALDQGRHEDAIASLEHAVRLRPGWSAAWKNLGLARFAAGDADAAERDLVRALELDPSDADTCLNLAHLRQQADDVDAAAHYLRLALDRDPDCATLLRLALLRPIFCDDAAEIARHRARIEADLALIAGERLTLTEPAERLGAPAFYFAYHGLDDRPLAARLGDIVTRAWSPPAPAVVRAPRRPRVAWVSAHFMQHTIGRLYAPLLERLPRDEFDLAVLSVGAHDDPLAARIRAAADIAVDVPADHARARRALAELDADVVFFPDVGMDATTWWLAAERFAPLQCAGWGHPVTTGLPSIDCFVSSALLEPDGAEHHYTETLAALPAWPVVYEDPGMPATDALARTALGVAAHEHVYLCPQSPFKLHPDFDAYLAAILARDRSARIVLLGSRDAWRQRLAARFERHLGADGARVSYLDTLTPAAFYALLGHADVVLDTIHFSGGITSFEALWAETPLVTERGAFMRGRVTAALCDLLEFRQGVASGPADYAERACELAHDGPARRAARDLIAANKPRLLALEGSVVAAYRAFFADALERAHGPSPRKLAS